MLTFLLSLVITSGTLDVYLQADWKGHSENTLKQELSEYFSDTQNFWTFIQQDLSLPLSDLLTKLTENPLEKALIWSSLYNREYSSRLEFYSSLASVFNSTCKPFFVINGIETCSLSKSLTKPAVSYSPNFDHIYRQGEGHIIAYVDITSSEFSELNRKIIKFCEDYNLTYILRHLDIRPDKTEFLGGFGAEIIMKNMEFNPTENVSLPALLLPKWNIEDITAKVIQKVMKYENLTSVKEFIYNFPEKYKEIEEIKLSSTIKRDLNLLLSSNVRIN